MHEAHYKVSYSSIFDSVSDELICRKRLKINGLHKICLVDLQD